MNRSLACVATGICAAPLLMIAGMMLTRAVMRPAGGADQAIAQGYAVVLGGIVFALVGGVSIWYLARQLVPDQRLGVLVAVDVVMLMIGVAIVRSTFAVPPQLEYTDASPLLQLEVRVPQEVLAGDRFNDIVAIDFAGGSHSSVPHPELARTEGNATIIPWETTPIRVSAWSVLVIVRNTELMFELPLAKRPDPSAEWSQWIAPRADSQSAPRGVTIRYRFQLTPYGR